MKRPTPSMAVSIAALVVALGGTSYAATQIQTQDIKRGAVTKPKVAKDAIDSVRIKNNSIQAEDMAPGSQQPGPQGDPGADGADGQTISRWALVEADGTISAQSGGFTVVSAYDFATVQTPAPPVGAQGNVYINTGEDLANNGIISTIALQNTVDQNGDAIMTGRASGADVNPEFSGEITASRCNFEGATGIPTNCAPADAKNATTLVVSPRMSDGSLTASTPTNTHKRFYVVLSGDSSDYTPAP